MIIRVLGPIEMSRAGELIPLGAAKQRAVLAVLAMEAGRCVGVDSLIDRVWGTDPPDRPRASLHAYTSRLRGALAQAGHDAGRSALKFLPAGYLLAIDPAQVDLHQARHLAAAAAAADPEEAAAMMAKALRGWGSRPLAGIDGEWAAAKRAALVRERICLIVRYADIQLSLGRHVQLLDEIMSLSSEYPTEEQLAALSMITLYRCGFRNESLKTYLRLRECLVHELGVEPCTELQALQRSILTGTIPVAVRPEPFASASRSAPPMQLPHRLADFCGRDQEIAELARCIREAPPGITPVISIRGAAGIGKSALAIEVAHRLADRYPDGQLYIRFRPGYQGAAEPVPERIASFFLGALGAPGVSAGSVLDGYGGASASFRSVLAGRKVLILLDDATAASDVIPLIPAGPGCAVLATSRGQALGSHASASITLGPLRGAAAITLISQIAGRKRVVADPIAAAKIAELCGHHPLALRIAGLRLAGRPDWRLTVLAKRLTEESTRLDELRFGELSMRDSLSASYASVVASAPDPLPARLFRLFGLWDDGEVDAETIAATASVPVETAELALDDLLYEHLIEPSGLSHYRIGVLARLYAWELLHQELELSARSPHDRD